MDTRAIALTIVFAALSIALTPIAIPAGYMLGSFYRLWEIPIVVAFLLFGPKIGITVAVLRTLAEKISWATARQIYLRMIIIFVELRIQKECNIIEKCT